MKLDAKEKQIVLNALNFLSKQLDLSQATDFLEIAKLAQKIEKEDCEESKDET